MQFSSTGEESHMDQNRPGGGLAGGGRNNGPLGVREHEHEEGIDLDELRRQLGDVNQRAVDFIRSRPGTALLLALGAGFLIGRILRS
jgi:hypothetical protein